MANPETQARWRAGRPSITVHLDPNALGVLDWLARWIYEFVPYDNSRSDQCNPSRPEAIRSLLAFWSRRIATDPEAARAEFAAVLREREQVEVEPPASSRECAKFWRAETSARRCSDISRYNSDHRPSPPWESPQTPYLKAFSDDPLPMIRVLSEDRQKEGVNSPRTAPPSPELLEHARKIALAIGLELPAEAETDTSATRAFIEEYEAETQVSLFGEPSPRPTMAPKWITSDGQEIRLVFPSRPPEEFRRRLGPGGLKAKWDPPTKIWTLADSEEARTWIDEHGWELTIVEPDEN